MADPFFQVSRPLPYKPKLFSILGTFPDGIQEGYKVVDDFLYELIGLDRDQPDRPFIFVINSPGGTASALWAILDTLSLLSSPVCTVARDAGSAAALLFIAGSKGRRYVFESSHLLLHRGQIPVQRVKRKWLFLKSHYLNGLEQRGLDAANDRIARLIYGCSDNAKLLQRLGDWGDEQDPEEQIRGIATLLEQDQLFNAKEAVECGLADHVISQKEFDQLFRQEA